jgi:transcriptional regulator with XRE-family HTH domain
MERERAVRTLGHSPEALKWARQHSLWSQGQLAKFAGISAGHMSEIESGTRSATPTVLAKFAEAMQCPVTMLQNHDPELIARIQDAVQAAEDEAADEDQDGAA